MEIIRTNDKKILYDGNLPTDKRIELKNGLIKTEMKSEDKNDDDQEDKKLWERFINNPELVVIETSRQKFISKKNLVNLEKRKASEVIEKVEDSKNFDYQNYCLICGEYCSIDSERKKKVAKRRKISKITGNGKMLDKVKVLANTLDDELSKKIKQRIHDVDLVAVGAAYHSLCLSKYVVRKITPTDQAGRPTQQKYATTIQRCTEEIENSDDCQFSYNDLCEKLSITPANKYYIKELLIKHYGNDIIFSWLKFGKAVMNYRGKTDKTMIERYQSTLTGNINEIRRQIVIDAANILREDIRMKPYETGFYPPIDEFYNSIDNDIPDTLRLFLNTLIDSSRKNVDDNDDGVNIDDITNKDPTTTKSNTVDTLKIKVNAIAHAILSAVRPRSFLSSILLGLSVYLRRKWSSKLLVDALSRLGFCSPYEDALSFEASNTYGKKRPSDIPNEKVCSGFTHLIFGEDFNEPVDDNVPSTPNTSVPQFPFETIYLASDDYFPIVIE